MIEFIVYVAHQYQYQSIKIIIYNYTVRLKDNTVNDSVILLKNNAKSMQQL
jgi:hypothetical protein